MNTERLFIGLMSGTSADSIDAALVTFTEDRCRLLASYNHPLSRQLKSDIHSLTLPGPDEIQRMGVLDHQLGEAFAEAAVALLKSADVDAAEVTAIGSHGQTIRHEPAHTGGVRFTLQIGNPHLIAERTGILTVADFRRRDIACGGQGAPLAPAFHQAEFSRPNTARCIVNIGGIANITVLPRQGKVTGFDTGPGNTLLDAWIDNCRGEPFDRNGAWAASGRVDMGLLSSMMQHPYLAQATPKSTGREAFNMSWLQQLLEQRAAPLAPEDVQATLLEFTATTIAEAIRSHCESGVEIYICGGGARNQALLNAVRTQLPDSLIATTLELGVEPDWVEAVAFAWLAKQHVDGLPGNLPEVTGASRAVVLGAAFPGWVSGKR